MKRLLSIIAATAAAAAVAAAISLPAGADDGPRQSDELATLTACLRSHGLAVPAGLEPLALKQWIGEHEDSPAIAACDLKPDKVKQDAVPPEKLLACLRDQGLTPPSTIDRLKPWMAQQDATTGRAALSACGVDSRPVEKAPGGCAGEKRADAAKQAKASKAKAAL